MGKDCDVCPTFQSACIDCPAARRGAFAEQVGIHRGDCEFRCPSVEPGETMPERWFRDFRLGLVRRGILLRHRVDARGRSTVVDVIGPGGMFLLGDDSGPLGRAASAVTRVLVCLLPNGPMEAITGACSPGSLDLLRLQAEALERLERISEARSRSSASARVAALLCLLADTLPGRRTDGSVTPDLRQRDLAKILGMRHETVCRVMRSLEEGNLIRRSPEAIDILDRPALEVV